tara:strand:+ start:1991 stop:2704 length:714 start_codon:yes stop_codon:yes gene_type:complete
MQQCTSEFVFIDGEGYSKLEIKETKEIASARAELDSITKRSAKFEGAARDWVPYFKLKETNPELYETVIGALIDTTKKTDYYSKIFHSPDFLTLRDQYVSRLKEVITESAREFIKQPSRLHFLKRKQYNKGDIFSIASIDEEDGFHVLIRPSNKYFAKLFSQEEEIRRLSNNKPLFNTLLDNKIQLDKAGDALAGYHHDNIRLESLGTVKIKPDWAIGGAFSSPGEITFDMIIHNII